MADAAGAPVSGDSGFTDLGFARVDTDRESRQGLPEAVYGPGKQVPEIVGIVQRLLDRNHGPVMVTRIEPGVAGQVSAALSGASYAQSARLLVWRPAAPAAFRIAIVTAGTADAPVADEAAAVAAAIGLDAEIFRDVGVAGLHRLLAVAPELSHHDALIVIAGMEAALASAVGGLVACPVIAVPTSVGYGASLEGVTALLGMLTSCAAGITVVNIDSGYGAAMAAYRVARATQRARTENSGG
jgi:NCAIR mutase (PurE)-related protein